MNNRTMKMIAIGIFCTFVLTVSETPALPILHDDAACVRKRNNASTT